MIRTAFPVQPCSQDEFHQIDRVVTGHAYAIHNELGRFLDERLYQRELAARCLKSGLAVCSEMEITVSYRDFTKKYVVDLLVGNAVVVETKAAHTLIGPHQGQTLNYLFLCGTQHGTLLNFRSVRVEHEFVSTRLTPIDRHRFKPCTEAWRPLGPEWTRLHDLMVELLNEWGAFLDPLLYRDALTHFLGGGEQVLRKVDVTTTNGCIGQQEMHLLTPTTGFSVTAVTREPEAMAEHQRRFLQHTPLEAIAWINLNRHDIEFRTITR